MTASVTNRNKSNNKTAPNKSCSVTKKKLSSKSSSSSSFKTSKPSKKDIVPIFLKKTYHMIDQCRPDIACWSEDGQTFVVKKVETFAADVIPQFFKHNKFASFVRQLNFYGFRKVKNDQIKIDTEEASLEEKHWRFRHENFQRGQPELLVEIRKASQGTSADQEQIDALKKEVDDLRSQISSYRSTIGKLTSLVENMTQSPVDGLETQEIPKCSRLDTDLNAGQCMISPLDESASSMPLHEQIHPDIQTSSPDANIFMPEAHPDNIKSSQNLPPPLDTPAFEVIDKDFAGLLGDDIGTDENFAELLPLQNSIDPALTEKLHNSLALFPKQMQEMFVARLVSSVDDIFHNQAQAISNLTTTPTTETHECMFTVKEETTDEMDNNVNPVSPENTSHQGHNPKEEPPLIVLPLAAMPLNSS